MKQEGDFPGGPVVRAVHLHCREHGFHPWSRTKISHAIWFGRKEKEKRQPEKDNAVCQSSPCVLNPNPSQDVAQHPTL